MKPFDDMLPAEQETRQRELIELLQQAARRPLTSDSPFQTQIITRVQQRLAGMKDTMLSSENDDHLRDDLSMQPGTGKPEQTGRSRSFPPKPASPPAATPRQWRRNIRVLNALAAVLAVGLLIGGALVLFRHAPQTQASGPSGSPVTVYGESNGLAMSLSITSGPYFLSEMLEIDTTLTNHTQSTEYVAYPFIENGCQYLPGVMVTGGNTPDFEIPIATGHSCPAGIGRTLMLQPDASLTAHTYLPLTNSGKQTLTGAVWLSNTPNRYKFSQYAWPSIKIIVTSQIPADRQLSFTLEGSHVLVTSPTGIPSHLVYLYGVWCKDFNNDGGSTGTGNYGWEPISTNRANEPGCPGKDVHWDFAFGTPGYAIAQGSYAG